jgi:AraC-like DNA-binding protein
MAFFKRGEIYGVRPAKKFEGMHHILTFLFQAPPKWRVNLPVKPVKLPPVWWRALMSLEDRNDYDSHGQRVVLLSDIQQFLENFATAGMRKPRARGDPAGPRRIDTEADWMETWAAAEDVIRQRAGSGLTADELAEAVHVSTAKLRRVFQIARGMSPKQAITRWRMEQAERLLGNLNLTVTQVAEQIGYSTVQRFCAAFKKMTKTTPSEYARRKSVK